MSLFSESLPEEVRLVRGIPVRVTISEALPLAPEGASITIALRANDPDWSSGKAGTNGKPPAFRYRRALWTEEFAVLPGETEWTVYVPGPGEYRPVWYVRHSTQDVVLNGYDKRSFTSEGGRGEIVVENTSGSATRWVVQPDLEEANEAMQPPE